MRRLQHVWLLVVLLALAACGKQEVPATFTPTAAPTIISDKEDYAPGELVTLTGSNWQPGESVHINVDDDQTKTWTRNINVTADENGNITDQFNLPDWFVATYQVVATGQDSGVANTSFTDGNVIVSKARVPDTGHQSVQAGGSWEFDMTLNKQGGGSDPTVNNPFVVINPIGDNKTPATCGKAETAIPASWLSVVSPSLPKAIGSPTAFKFRVAPAAGASGTYTGRVNLTTTDGGSQTFDLCLTITAANNPAPTLTSVSPTSATQGDTLDVEFTGTNFSREVSSVNFGPSVTVNSTTVNSATKITANITVDAGAATGARNVTVTNAAPGGGTATLTDGFTVNAACTAPFITTQPVGATKTVDERVTFSVMAGGTGPLSYQWRKDGNNIGDSTSYTIHSVRVVDAGNYSVVVKGQCGSVTSDNATLTVNKAQATVSLSNLEHTYNGSAKAATATTVPANLDGLSISYSQNGKPVSAPTNAGSYDVVAKLDNDSYSAQDATGTLVIGKASQMINFAELSNKTFGDPSFEISVSGGASGNPVSFSVNGNCALSGTSVSIDGAGSCTITASQVGNSNYDAAQSVARSFSIAKADQTLAWANPDAITYGAALSGTQLNASLTKGDGVLSYNPALGTVLNAGTHTLKVTAEGSSNYNETSKMVSITVNQADQEISWSNPAQITYDTPLGTAQLNATRTVGDGALSYDPPAGTLLNVGTHTLKVTAAETANYKAASKEVGITVTKVNQEIAWNNPAAITYSTPLSTAQLNASLTKGDGALTYSPAAGTLLDAGTHTLTVNAAETANSNPASKQVSITVNKADQRISFTGAPSTAVFGSSFTVSATGGASGLPVVLKADGACTIDGNNVTMISGAGICNLTADQGGNNNYNAATQASQSTTAEKATATVSLSNLSYDFDGTSKSATVTTNPVGLSVAVTYNTSSTAPSAVGSYSVTATVNDLNYQGSASGTLTIKPWTTQGFFSPVDYNGAFNTVKNGSTVPLKFRVFKGTEQLTSTSVVSGLKPLVASCSTGATIDDIEELTTGSTSLRYDTSGGQFIFNWQTPKKPGTCYNVTVQMVDGTSIPVAKFWLK